MSVEQPAAAAAPVEVRRVSEWLKGVAAVRDVSFRAGVGQLVAIRGRSGAGKTTLLNMIGGLDRPASGRVFVGPHEISAAGERTLLTLRRSMIGFVFQSFGLVPILSAAAPFKSVPHEAAVAEVLGTLSVLVGMTRTCSGRMPSSRAAIAVMLV